MNQNVERLTFRAPEILRPALEAYLSFDPERMAALFSDDAVVDDSRLPQPIRGRDEIVSYFGDVFGRILSFKLHRSHIFAIRNSFLVVIEATMVPKAFPDRPMLYIGGTSVELDEAGIIHQYRVYIDPQAILQMESPVTALALGEHQRTKGTSQPQGTDFLSWLNPT
jgi:hypothetical protein